MDKPVRTYRGRRFNVDILMIFGALIIPTVIIISSFIYFKTVKVTHTITESLVEKVSNAVIEKTSNYLKPAHILVEIAPSLIEDSDKKIEFGSGLEKLFVDIVRRQPQADLFYYGTEQGNFVQADGLDKSGAISTKLIDRSESPTRYTYYYRNPAGQVIKESSNTDEDYDPRLRPWYIGAKKTRKTYWTDLYVFYENKKLGITVASPVMNNKDELIGVVGADITLDGLSQFLSELDVSKNGIVFILDRSHQFVAFPDEDKMVTVENGEIRPVLATELNEKWITDGIRHYEDTGEKSFIFESEGERYITKFTSFPESFGKDWTIVVMLPESDFLGVIDETSITIIYITTGILAIAIFFGLLFARNLSRPIEALTAEVKRIHKFDFSDTAPVTSHIEEIQSMSDAVVGMKSALLAFRRYVPASLVRNLIESGEEVKPGGKEKEITLFFSDIKGFTSIAEQIPARKLMVEMSEYFEVWTSPIAQNNGTVVQFVGDEVMAFWGAPVDDEEQAIHACQAALDCQRQLHLLNERRVNERKTPFITRVGLHTGLAVVGNRGSSERFDYAAVGDNVNLASRLEGLNKRYGTNIIISQTTYGYVGKLFILRPLDNVAVAGKKNSILIFELMGDAQSDNYENLVELSEQFKKAYDLYYKRKWKEALKIFEALHEKNPEDYPTNMYIERCIDLITNDPGQAWTGYIKLNEK